MIARADLLNAIAECQDGTITQNKCDKLASYYVIYDHLYGNESEYGASSDNTRSAKISTNSGSEFLRAINGMDALKALTIIDELMETLKVINPRLYDGVLRRLGD